MNFKFNTIRKTDNFSENGILTRLKSHLNYMKILREKYERAQESDAARFALYLRFQTYKLKKHGPKIITFE